MEYSKCTACLGKKAAPANAKFVERWQNVIERRIADQNTVDPSQFHPRTVISKAR